MEEIIKRIKSSSDYQLEQSYVSFNKTYKDCLDNLTQSLSVRILSALGDELKNRSLTIPKD